MQRNRSALASCYLVLQGLHDKGSAEAWQGCGAPSGINAALDLL